MKWSVAWRWIVGLAAAVLAEQTNILQAVFSTLLFLALASAILLSFALFSVDVLDITARGLEFVERSVRDVAARARTILSHSLHHLPACVDPRQGLFLLLPILAKQIGSGIRRLLQPHGKRRARLVHAKEAAREEIIVSRECR